MMRTLKTATLGNFTFEARYQDGVLETIYLNGEPFQVEDIQQLVGWLMVEVFGVVPNISNTTTAPVQVKNTRQELEKELEKVRYDKLPDFSGRRADPSFLPTDIGDPFKPGPDARFEEEVVDLAPAARRSAIS